MAEPRVITAKLRARKMDAMPRDRLLRALASVWRHRLTLVLAPAGSGKTTLLSQFADGERQRAAWYRADTSDGDPTVLLAHLEAATRATLGDVPGPWRSAADAAAALECAASTGMLLVIDDLHALQHTPAEVELGRLLDYLPDGVAILAASRAEPDLNLSRLRLSGALCEIGADALRFRSWEVEQLFRDFYREPLAPEELTELARRTGGWAAALQLFHLATRGKSREGRRNTLAGLATDARLTREYLTRNVLDDLDDSVRTFLLGTSVLGRLNGSICDKLLGRRGSATLLTHLERRQLFTHALDEDGWYRYHEVLRAHLEATLAEQIGEVGLRDQRRRAGEILEEAHAYADALEAYCRAEQWDGAARMLGLGAWQAVCASDWWLDLLPASLLDHDPWMMLATARRHAAEGWLQGATHAYRRAEQSFADATVAESCRRERAMLEVWRDTGFLRAAGWSGQLRTATMSHPLVVRQRVAQAATSPERLVAGIAALLAGHVRLARESLRQVQADSDSTDTVRMMASVATAMSSVLGDEEVAVEPLDRAVDEAERMGLWWLARLGHDALSSIDETNRGAPPPPDAAAYDPWGPALGNFLYCWGEVRRGAGDTRRLEAIAATFRRLDAPVLEVWSRALCAVVAVRQGRSEGRDIALQAEALARAVGVDGAQALALLALAEANPETCDPTLAAAMADRLGLRLPGPIGPVGCTGGRTSTRAPLVITCLSAFSFTVRGRRLDLGAAKPRVRSLLRLLSLYAGRPVHREVIAEALWPEVDCESGTRSLQVAVSALRQLLEPGVARSASSLVLRDGEAYRLGLPKGSSIDILDFDDLATRGRTAWLTGDAGAAVAALGGALDLYRGELLPEEGPAEWVVKERERLCSTAVEAAATLALVYERDRNATACASACERGLSIDRYRDCLWRRLIDVHTAAGDFASAARARRGYAAVLAELGITDGAPEGRGVVGVDRRFLWRAAG